MYPNMKRLLAYIALPLLLVTTAASAQETESPLDSVQLGNLFRLKANGTRSGSSDLFAKSPEVDVANALYGQFSGLLVKNSSSVYDSNRSRLKLSLRLHGIANDIKIFRKIAELTFRISYIV